jgi:hypothetical protein
MHLHPELGPAVSVFTGSNLGTLAELGSDNPRLRSGGPLARLNFVATAGTAYQFDVTGGETTTIQLVQSALPLARIVSPAASGSGGSYPRGDRSID